MKMQSTRSMSMSSLCTAIRRALLMSAVLTSCAVAADANGPNAAADPAPQDSTGQSAAPAGKDEPQKPSLMSEVKVIGYQTSSATSATGVVTDIIDTPI